ncbi:MAG: S8 family peptidase [Pseudomonadales bacterium]
MTQISAWPIESLMLYCVVFQANQPEVSLNTLLSQLNNTPGIDAAQPSQLFIGMTQRVNEAANFQHEQEYDDPLFELQYGEYREQLQRMHQISKGAVVRVGVVDSSVDHKHPDLLGQITRQYNLAGERNANHYEHGTAITGVIGAAEDNGEGVVGLAPSASIFVYGACRDHAGRSQCDSLSLALAIDQAITDEVQVLNLSLAGPVDPLLTRLLDRAIAQQTVVVAARNETNAQRNFPANHQGVHSVGSDHNSWFASSEQFSTVAGGGYRVFFGSSVAAAGVSGFATLLRSRHNAALTNTLIERTLASHCNPMDVMGSDPLASCQ